MAHGDRPGNIDQILVPPHPRVLVQRQGNILQPVPLRGKDAAVHVNHLVPEHVDHLVLVFVNQHRRILLSYPLEQVLDSQLPEALHPVVAHRPRHRFARRILVVRPQGAEPVQRVGQLVNP